MNDKVNTLEDIEKAKKKVLNNTNCSICFKSAAILKKTLKSLPIEIINIITSNNRCEDCINMIKLIVIQDIDYPETKLDIYKSKLFYYIELNKFPKKDYLEYIKKNHYKILKMLYYHIETFTDTELIIWKKTCEAYFWDTNGEHLEDAADEFNTMFEEFKDVIKCIDSVKKEHNILYGVNFGEDIIEKLDNVFYGDDDVDLDDPENSPLLENIYHQFRLVLKNFYLG